jgi:hypothetical protein
MKRPDPPVPGQVRTPRGAYGWVDLRVVTAGWLEKLGPQTALTYLFFCTVGNSQGVSFWGRGRIGQTLGLSRESVEEAVKQLRAARLVATREHVVQVLPLPLEEPREVAPGAAAKPPEPDVVLDEATRVEFEPRARQMLAVVLGATEPAPRVLRALTSDLARRHRAGLVECSPGTASEEARHD